MRRATWIAIAWLFLLHPGCSPRLSHSGFTGPETHPTATTPSASDNNQAFDLGPVLARGQTIRHEFALTNPSGRAIRLMRATYSAPCCSSVEPLPESIPPHAEVKAAVVFKPGYQSGPRAVRFAIETDSAERSVQVLTLRAVLFSEWEIARVGDPVETIPLGKAGKEVWRVVCRRNGSEGLRWPDTVKVAEPLRARLLGPVKEKMQPDGVIEASRDIEVALPTIPKPGTQQAEIAFLWSDGHRRTHLIRWEITPLVRVSPSSIVIEPSGKPIERFVTVTSDDAPFRITKVHGALLASSVEPSLVAEKTHCLTLRLDPAQAVAGGVSNIVIGTDHPLQSEQTVRVLILPSEHQERGGS